MFGWWKITVFGIIFTIFVLVWVFLFGLSSNQPGSFFNKGNNAVWIAHEWVGEPKSDEEIQDFVDSLKKHQIGTVFVHTGPLKEDGTVDPDTYKHAINFIDSVKKFDKKIDYQAWLGQLRSKIDLSDEEVRNNIKNLCIILTQMVGFDGIHFDIEPVWDEDEDFIKLLKEVREGIPDKYLLSAALAEFIPQSFLWYVENVYSFEKYNSEVNYKNVAKYADQIIVMVYDTGINNEWIYRWFIKEETIRVTDLLENKEVFIAIPSYDEEKEGFNPKAENMENGLKGIIKGLNNFRSNENSFAGVAIYPYWEIDKEEWKMYEELWLK
ncbi:hypothetical protein GF366_02365 [Candidatus Peregrinibacteria bacterium]|nr:hypothetical protein [Candidatus Peregrinibacteria bacterium]